MRLQDKRIEANSGREQHKFTIRAKRMAGRGDVPQVPRRPLVGRSELARVPGRLQPRTDAEAARQPAPATGTPQPPAACRPARRTRRTRDRQRRAEHSAAPAPAAAEARRSPARRRRRGAGAARRRRGRRQEHVRVAGRADGDQRARRSGQAADRQPDRHQQPAQAHPRRQDLLHPPAGLRAGAGGQEVPEHEPALRRGRRQAHRGHAGAHQSRPGHRPAGQGRQALPGGGRHQALRDDAVRPVRLRLRGHRPARPRRQADRRRLCRRDDFADQPRHHRHRALGAAADGRPGRHHRRRRDGIPGRVPGRQRGAHRRAGHRQADHPDLDLRPPHHPGRGIRRLPAHHPRDAALGRLLGRDLPRAGHPVPAGALEHRQPGLDRRQERPGHGVDRGLPQPRSPDGRHRPAAAGQDPVPQPPRPRSTQPRPDAVGPRPGVQGRRLRRLRVQEAARRSRPAARRLLPPHRRGVHPHPRTRTAAVAAGAGRDQARQTDCRRTEVHPEQAERRRGLRDVPADQIRWAEAVLAGRRRERDPDDGRGDRPVRRARPRRGGHRDAAPRPAQRAGQHRRQAVLADLQRVRGQPEPVAGARLRRRQVPPRRHRHVPTDVRRQRHSGVADRQPVAPGGRRPGAGGPGAGQAGPAGQGLGDGGEQASRWCR